MKFVNRQAATILPSMDNKDSSSECCAKPDQIGWAELMTNDAEMAIEFYTSLFDWETEKFPNPEVNYTILKHNGKPFGGVVSPSKPFAPPQWVNYVVVESLDDTLTEGTRRGATICMGPMNIPDVGRIAIIQDCQGAIIGLHQPESK